MEDDLNFFEMEDDLKFLSNGRRPYILFLKWKTTSIFRQLEDHLNLYTNGRRPQIYCYGRKPQYFSSNGRRPQF